ncbi:MAG TPA: hypothetical protein VIF62_19120 [Labilithrix sp.]
MMELPFAARADDDVELVVCDLGLARALWEGVPTARLLARVRVERDIADLVDDVDRASGLDLGDSTWDQLAARLLKRSPAAFERVKRAVNRHTRAASDEGPLAAGDVEAAALIHVFLSASDGDASPAEGASEALAIDDAVRSACAELDARLGAERGDRRPAAFEACVRLATLASAPIAKLASLAAAIEALGGDLAASAAPFYPWGDDDVRVVDRRACLVERAGVVVRPDAAKSTRIAQDVAQLAARRGALVLFVTPPARPLGDAPSLPPSSWLPSDFGTHGAAQQLASALEGGATTVPRARAVIARGGEPALDAIGKEMLDVAAHPFASAVFAELLAMVGRERDVVRLVGYFAIAPDPTDAARVLSLCTGADVATVLRAWLESMLPSDGGDAARGGDPEAPGSRLATYLHALEPFPDLYSAVRPLLARVSEPPPSN